MNFLYLLGGTLVKNSRIGRECIIKPFTKIINSGLEKSVKIDYFNSMYNSKLGKYSYTGKNTIIYNSIIGNYTSISWNVTIGAPEHRINLVTTSNILYEHKYGFVSEPVYNPISEKSIIGNDVWIRANVVINSGVKVGDGAVVGAGAVVTRDIQDYAIAVGAPVRVIKYRFSGGVISRLKKIKWWEFLEGIISHNNISLFKQKPDECIENLERLTIRLYPAISGGDNNA